MEKKETLELIRLVMVYYPNFKFGHSEEEQMDTLTAWHGILKDYEVLDISRNLIEYVKSGSPYPPIVGQLLGVREKRTIPNLEETRLMFEKKDRERLETQKLLQDPEEQRKIAEVKASIRATLGMPKREEG